MATRVDSYKCDICDAYYISETEALECEKLHTSYEKLELGDVFYKRDHEYPYLVIIDDGSGHASLYTQTMEGSVEDVFEEFDSLKKVIRTNPDEDECY